MLGLCLVAACGPGSVAATTDDPASASGPVDTDSATGSVLTSTPTPTTTATASDPGTTMPGLPDTTSTATTAPDTTATTAPDTTATTATTTAASTTSDGASTGEPTCPAGTVLCIDDAIAICDGQGGFEPAPPDNACTFGCADESKCMTCEQAIAKKACPAGLPRVMILLDASSSMINLPAPRRWDQARGALAGDMSMFDLVFAMQPFSIQALAGLSVFGSNADEARLLLQYGACHQPNIAWALDPQSSCLAPGCADPDAPPPIKWTSQDGAQIDPPGFSETTLSHMPRCDFSAQMPQLCIGSKRFLHLGLDQVRSNLMTYKASCKQAALPCTAQTQFLNVLITDGKFDSTDAQVQPLLEQLFASGVTTHVIGLGPGVDPIQLAKLADWGSGKLQTAHLAADQAELTAQLEQVLGMIEFC